MCHVDTLAFTFKDSSFDSDDAILLARKVLTFSKCSDFDYKIVGGRNGYQYCIDFGTFFIAWGGSFQRSSVYVYFSGSFFLLDIDMLSLHDLFLELDAKITRIDLAFDTDKNIYSIDSALSDYSNNLFTFTRRPKARLIDDLGNGTGKTFYCGSRTSGKMLRVYEKGKQMGLTSSTWVRIEVEFLAKDRILDFDMLLNPALYLSGSYPAFSFISSLSKKIRTFKRETEASVSNFIKYVHNNLSSHINFLFSLATPEEFLYILNQSKRYPKKLRFVDRLAFKDTFLNYIHL